ncbi:MAG: hypothetical protein K2Q01_07375, partial [Rickettsiales bacterium]|nr:hypothetical protein [Rickettsiales bacterium]
MLGTIRARFIFIGFLLVSATLASSIENFITDKQTENYSNTQHITTEVIQKHMEADMVHDGIRGNVYSALYASRTGNAQLLKESQQ